MIDLKFQEKSVGGILFFDVHSLYLLILAHPESGKDKDF